MGFLLLLINWTEDHKKVQNLLDLCEEPLNTGSFA